MHHAFSFSFQGTHKIIMTILQAFIHQVQILLIGITLLLIRIIITKDDSVWRQLRTTTFNNNYFTAYLVVLWFIIMPIVVWYYNFAEFGIWGELYKQSPILTWCTLAIVVLFNGFMLWKCRKDNLITE